MTNRLYIAGPFSAKGRVTALADRLRPLGYELHARWVAHHYEHEGGIENPKNAAYARFSAEEDVMDAEKATTMIVLMEPHEGSHYGWLVELGIGLVSAEEVWMVGKHPVNVFGFLSGIQSNGVDVRFFATDDDVVEHAMKEQLIWHK